MSKVKSPSSVFIIFLTSTCISCLERVCQELLLKLHTELSKLHAGNGAPWKQDGSPGWEPRTGAQVTGAQVGSPRSETQGGDVPWIIASSLLCPNFPSPAVYLLFSVSQVGDSEQPPENEPILRAPICLLGTGEFIT